jgi:protein TonB
MIVTICLNLLIFLAIPFLSQLRDAKTDPPAIIGDPVRVSMQADDPAQKSAQEEPQPPEPEEPSRVPEPRIQPQEVRFSPSSPPDLPEMNIDMPQIDLGQITVSKPTPPARTEAKTPQEPQPESSEQKTAAQPEPAGKKRYSLSEVDSQPRLASRVNPTYPFRAKRRGVEGKVVVRFLVDKLGRVSQSSVVQAEPEGVFEQSALKAVRQWRFEPGTKDGRPVATWVQVPIRFELKR